MWVRIEDTFYDHPKVLAAGNAAVGLHVRGLSYACHHLTDGFLPMLFLKGQLKTAERLVLHGLWERVEGGYRIHDYLKFNPAASDVKAQREASRVRMNNTRTGRATEPELPTNNTRSSLDVAASDRDSTKTTNRPRNERRVHNLAARAREIERTLEAPSDLRDFLASDRAD